MGATTLPRRVWSGGRSPAAERVRSAGERRTPRGWVRPALIALLAATPVAALMFRFNNPDALLVCLLVASAYCLVRALEHGSTRWMVGVGTLIGFAFLAKMMQAFLVVPGFALVYLVAAPTPVRRRLGQLLAGGAAMIAGAGWWVAIVALLPASSRQRPGWRRRVRRHGARRQRRRGCWRAPGHEPDQRRAGHPVERRLGIPLGGGDVGLAECRRARASRGRRTGHGHRWFQRPGRSHLPRPVRGLRKGG